MCRVFGTEGRGFESHRAYQISDTKLADWPSIPELANIAEVKLY